MTMNDFDKLGYQTRRVLSAMTHNGGDVIRSAVDTGSSIESIRSMMCRLRKKFRMSDGELFKAVLEFNRTAVA